MKSHKFFILPFIAACFALLVCCTEEEPSTPATNGDYRDAWIGTYLGNTDVHTSSEGDHQADTTYTDQSIALSKCGTDSLALEYLGNRYYFSCSTSGEFNKTDNPHSGYYGNISGDSLFFHYYNITSGHSVSQFFKGKKQ